MADLDDLGFTSISDMSNDEGLERLRQIRLSRRTPTKVTKTTTISKKSTPAISSDQAAELLKILTGEN
jgi:hypothetical protein